ncbi:hypothetical protein RHMOL_Rhmol01G0186400 [Rhododendron molle]|uniref:Uncharacterized protein n=1 Tax=Rhododendron molle TaxID=49168 RepID=A0ACC0Q4B3_RHOML|nr:hypothetical protein RHMOL_Rhmol01G0186400 [Rhododendron molle]
MRSEPSDARSDGLKVRKWCAPRYCAHHPPIANSPLLSNCPYFRVQTYTELRSSKKEGICESTLNTVDRSHLSFSHHQTYQLSITYGLRQIFLQEKGLSSSP